MGNCNNLITSKYGKLDVLVNNAGTCITKKFEDFTEADWIKDMDVNVKGVFLGTKNVLPAMLSGGGGSIINISSISGIVGSPNVPVYSAAKGAVRIFSKSIALQYAKAEEVAELLKNVTEKITIDPTGNKLLVTASPKKIAEVVSIVKEIDKPSIQIMLEARLIEVSLTDEEELGIDWEKLASTSIIFAESGPPQQITDNLITGSYLPGGSWEVIDPDPANTGDEFLMEIVQGTATGQHPDQMPFTRGSSSGLSRQLTAFDLTLDMMIKDNKADIITNSQIVTVNGHEATIEMVDVIPYLASSGGFGNSNFQVLKESVGIKLHILPYVNTDGYITTKITPEVSSIQSWTAQGYPWTKKRESTTTVRVKDGETILIAGLITTEAISTESKVPLLWRIPWVGKKWFTHTETQDKKTDLIIQVTPSVIKDNYSGIDKKDYHKESEKKALERRNEEN